MLYEYKCEKCGLMEINQSIKDDKLTVCPECGGEHFDRVVSGGMGFVLGEGGVGWERDSYSKSSSE